MRTVHVWLACVSAVAATGLGLSVWEYVSLPRVAYVNNTVLLRDYQGVVEGRRAYEGRVAQLQSVVDTLSVELAGEERRYQAARASMGEEQRASAESNLVDKRRQLAAYRNAMDEQIRREDERLSAGVLNQIDSFLSEYGETHGYDYILGATSGGSILYARQADDITLEVLDGLNRRHGGE